MLDVARKGSHVIEEKPLEVLELFDLSDEVFRVVQRIFQVPRNYELKLEDVDAAAGHISETHDLAVHALRRLQHLRMYSSPGSPVTVVAIATVLADLRVTLAELGSRTNDADDRGTIAAFRHQISTACYLIQARYRRHQHCELR
jgi:hypothetical protein